MSPGHERLASQTIEALADEYLDRMRRGESPQVEEYRRRYPQWSDEIEELFGTIQWLEESKEGLSAEEPPPSSIPERLGDYRLVKEMGRGGMGVVYEAVHLRLERKVAVKVLIDSLGDRSRVERFLREAYAAANLHHTHIVPVYAVGKEKGFHFFVMQHIEGKTLRDLAREPGSRDWRRVANIGLQIAEALEYAHGQGTLHRDIKPSNLLLDDEGHVWITDFGVAKVKDQEDLTLTGDLVGTVRYMAPEQLQGKSDSRSDVYALGLTLYELATGREAFGASDHTELLLQIKNGRVVRPRRIDGAIPQDLETVILGAMALDPQNRYGSAGELAEDLRRLLDGRPILARRTMLWERAWKWCRRNPTSSALGALAIVSVLVAATTGWLGFVQTKDALRREALRREEAEAAQRDATRSAALSREALEEIFEAFGKRRTFEARGPRGRRDQDVLQAGLIPLLESVLAFYDRYAREHAADSSLQHEAARAYQRVGDIQHRLGRASEANQAYAKARSMYASLMEETPQKDSFQAGWIESTVMMEPDLSPESKGETRQALKMALSKARVLVGEESTEVGNVILLAKAEQRMGELEFEDSNRQRAEEHFVQARALTQELQRTRPGSESWSAYFGAVLSLSDFYRSEGRLEDVRRSLEEAVEETTPGRTMRGARVELSALYRELSDVLHRLGEGESAVMAAKRADELQRSPRRGRRRFR